MRLNDLRQGYLLFSVLLITMVVSGISSWLLSRQHNQLQTLSNYEQKMRLFRILEKQVDICAQKIIQTDNVINVQHTNLSNGASIDLQIHLLIEEDNRQIWEIQGLACLKNVQTKITKVVTKVVSYDIHQDEHFKSDEGSWSME